MKQTIKQLLLFLIVWYSWAASAQENITTFILVRHAEKDLTQSTNDPDLAPEGKQRAIKLADMLQQTPVTAIYSTPYKRTRQTVDVLAGRKRITVSDYTANDEAELARMIAANKGGTVVVTGHSNTIPWMANKLLGTEKYRPLEDGDYGTLWIITVAEKEQQAKLLWLSF